jgi:hypothetical protein
MVRAFTCLLTARSVRRFVRPFGTAWVRAAKISLSAVSQCCSASPWGEPLATHIWYARSRIRSDKCWSMLLFHFADFAHFVERAFKFAGSLFDSAWTRNCLNRRCYWDMRANDARPTPHLAPSGLLPAVLPLRHGVVADIRAFCIAPPATLLRPHTSHFSTPISSPVNRASPAIGTPIQVGRWAAS